MKKITDLKGNEVIHCSTKEEANNYRNLFNYFSNKHQLLLTINDMDAIIRECGKFSRDWVPVEQSLPNNLETVWIANKKGYVNLVVGVCQK